MLQEKLSFFVENEIHPKFDNLIQTIDETYT